MMERHRDSEGSARAASQPTEAGDDVIEIEHEPLGDDGRRARRRSAAARSSEVGLEDADGVDGALGGPDESALEQQQSRVVQRRDLGHAGDGDGRVGEAWDDGVGGVEVLARVAAALQVSAIEDMPWGMHEFTLKDPSGNNIRIGRSTANGESS